MFAAQRFDEADEAPVVGALLHVPHAALQDHSAHELVVRIAARAVDDGAASGVAAGRHLRALAQARHGAGDRMRGGAAVDAGAPVSRLSDGPRSLVP